MKILIICIVITVIVLIGFFTVLLTIGSSQLKSAAEEERELNEQAEWLEKNMVYKK